VIKKVSENDSVKKVLPYLLKKKKHNFIVDQTQQNFKYTIQNFPYKYNAEA